MGFFRHTDRVKTACVCAPKYEGWTGVPGLVPASSWVGSPAGRREEGRVGQLIAYEFLLGWCLPVTRTAVII